MKKLSVGIPITTTRNPLLWLTEVAAPKLLSIDREPALRDKMFHEPLVAHLMAAAGTIIEGKPFYPVLEFTGDNYPDAGTIDDEGNGMIIQVVSTSQAPRDVSDDKEDVTSLILERIQNKHRKGEQYTEGAVLVVFVTQSKWKIDSKRIVEAIQSNHDFIGYWCIAPYNGNDSCCFLVDNLWNTPEGNTITSGLQLVIDFTPPAEYPYFNSLKSFSENAEMYPLTIGGVKRFHESLFPKV